MTRDLTQKQFEAACKRHGFETYGMLGYFRLPDTDVRVSVLNAGSRRRDQLSYLIQKNRQLSKKYPK